MNNQTFFSLLERLCHSGFVQTALASGLKDMPRLGRRGEAIVPILEAHLTNALFQPTDKVHFPRNANDWQRVLKSRECVNFMQDLTSAKAQTSHLIYRKVGQNGSKPRLLKSSEEGIKFTLGQTKLKIYSRFASRRDEKQFIRTKRALWKSLASPLNIKQEEDGTKTKLWNMFLNQKDPKSSENADSERRLCFDESEQNYICEDFKAPELDSFIKQRKKQIGDSAPYQAAVYIEAEDKFRTNLPLNQELRHYVMQLLKNVGVRIYDGKAAIASRDVIREADMLGIPYLVLLSADSCRNVIKVRNNETMCSRLINPGELVDYFKSHTQNPTYSGKIIV